MRPYTSALVAGLVPVAVTAYIIVDILNGNAGDPPLVAYLELGNLLLGLVLALPDRFRARGMSRAMGAMALGQIAIAAALIGMEIGTARVTLMVSTILALFFGGAAWAFAEVDRR